jgi:two-component system cell cycle sensor histidine kinase/response regulator CckA
MIPFPGVEIPGINYWRERILAGLFGTGVVLAFFALFPLVVWAVNEKLYGLLVVDVIMFLVTLGMIFIRPLKYQVRAGAALMITYILGVFITSTVGFVSGGPAWLFSFAVIAGLLLGLRTAIFALILNGATVIAVVMFAGHLNGDLLSPFASSLRAWAAFGSFILLNGATAVSAAYLVRGLEASATENQRTASELKQEHAKLFTAQKQLKAEIKERIRFEEDLKKSEQKYRLLAESINDVIWTMDLELNFQYISPAIVKLQGWTADEAVSLGIDSMLLPKSRDLALNVFEEQLALGEQSGDFNRSVTLELELNCKNGAVIWVETTASFMLDDTGRPSGILGVSRDVTERKRAIQEKEQLQLQLERSKKMEAVGTLAGGVAHDLNNVLSGIVGYPELLLMSLPEDSQLRKPIEMMQESGKKAAAIVEDLLTLTRRGVMSAEVLNLNDIVRSYLSSPEFAKLRSFHPAMDIELRLTSEPSNIVGSALHLTKTLMNLVSNAAEAMPNGGKITISTANARLDRPIPGYDKVRRGNYAVLTVSDTGIGILASEINRIFEPFYTKKKMGRSGTGLGMAVVWGTVQDHKGYIQVDSTVGKGSVFTLYFPISRKDRKKEETSFCMENYAGYGQSILLVDDVKEQRDIGSEMLSQLGYQVTAVGSGEEAVEYLKSKAVDLLILDMIMTPGMDGLDTYKQIKSINPRQKAIISSGYSETARVKEAQNLGVGQYIKKPYTLEQIALAVKTELGGTDSTGLREVKFSHRPPEGRTR